VIRDAITANGNSVQPSISGDGRWIAFASDATDLAPDDHNSKRDIFVCDTASGAVELITRNFFGEQANQDSERPDISEHGRFVGFESDATNLTPNDNNGIRDAFMIEIANGQVGRISAPASDSMESPSGFGTVSVAGEQNNDPPVFGELPDDFGTIGPGDDDDGGIIPGVCNLVPGCQATDVNGVPTEVFNIDAGQEFIFTMTGRTLCLSRTLTLDLQPNSQLPPGASHTPAFPVVGPVGGRVSSDFEWPPTPADTGQYTLRSMPTADVDRIGTCVITINVGSCDDVPTCDIDYAGALVIDAGTPISFTLSAQAFCDDQPIRVESLILPMNTMTMPSLPALSNGGAPLNVEVQWTPTIDDVGQQREFLFRATDVFGQSSECRSPSTSQDLPRART
jgi:hypothetical protein